MDPASLNKRGFAMKKIFLIVMILGLCSGVAAAQEQEKKSGIAEWLKGLQNKIAQIVPKKTVPMSTGVAGVRGAKEDAQVKLYWKGKKGEDAVTEDEMSKFKSGVDLAEKGDKESSLKQLDEFMKQYPDSALIPDAKKTYDLVKVMPKPEPKVEEKVEQKADEKHQEQKAEVKEEKKEEQK
jgi:hypothetical protein